MILFNKQRIKSNENLRIMKQINSFFKSKGLKLQLLIALIVCSATVFSQPLAFPTAEGYGKYTVGGRGGVVYEVTNLNDAEPGSLRAAVEASGPRTVVFRVSGTITLNSNLKISNPYITIAGQTAPGDGICLRKYPLVISANQVIIRHIRVRFGNESGVDADAISSRYVKNLILDHVSASWSVDETMSIYHCDSITVQWCMISESMYNSNHIKGAHGFGGIWGSNYSSYHHNLIASHASRNPRFASGCGNTDYRNNVIYNWGYNSCYGGEKQQEGDPAHAFTNINMVANYYKPGPATQPSEVSYRIVQPSSRNGAADFGKWYIADNKMVGSSNVTANNWNGVNPDGGSSFISGLKLDQPWPAMPINQQTAEDAYTSVLENAGVTLPKRDAVDLRIVDNVRNGNATYEGITYKKNQSMADKTKISGIIDSQTDVGGWPELNSTTAPTDSDHDGMPDQWETENGLNPNDQNDCNAFTLSPGKSYTNLEVYLNSIAGESSFVPVTGVSISPETLITYVDASTQLIATVEPINADNKNVTWSSNDTSVVKVNSTGLITCVNAGRASIMVTTEDGGKTATLEINVKPVNVHVIGITIDPDTASVYIDSTIQLNTTILPSDADNKNVTWSSNNISVATVSSTGLVTGLALGTTTVTVTSQDGGKIASSEITVAPVKVTGVKVDPSQTTISVGASKQLTASVLPVNATNKNVTWSSSDTSVVLVSATGRVSSLKEGSSTITVTTEDGSKTDSCIVSVVFSAIPIQLINLGFNENSGNIVTNAGSVPITLTKSTPPSWSTNVFVNGGASSVDFGTTSGDYYVESSSVINELAGLNSFTITGWVNCRNSTVGSGGNRIVSWINNGAHGVDVVYMSDGSLKVGINQWPDKTIAISSAGKITTNENGSVSNWKFFAVTYESSVSTLQFYFGDNFNQASLDQSISYPQGAVGSTIGKLAIGHFNSESRRSTRTDRIFRGLIDQIEVYNSVLPLRDIQTIQNIGTIISVAGITVTPSTTSINVGADVQLNTTITPTDAYNKSVTWNSDNISIATVSSTGLVKGISAGTATITATAEDGGKNASCIVEVKSTTSSEKYDLYDPSGITIYPNPTSDMLTIEFSKEFPENKTISLFDITGKSLKVVQSNALINMLDISDLPSGIYMVKISGSIFNVMKRITKR
jgi:uncharacterized protein YjdB